MLTREEETRVTKIFISLSSLLHASEILRTAHFVLSSGCSEVADSKNRFFDFLQIKAAFLKTNYITFSYLPIPIDEQNMSGKKFPLWPLVAEFRLSIYT